MATVEAIAQGEVRRPRSPRWGVLATFVATGVLVGATVAVGRTAEHAHTLVGTVVDRYTTDPYGAGSLAPRAPLLGTGYVVVVRDEQGRVLGTSRLRVLGTKVTRANVLPGESGWRVEVITKTYAYTVTGLPTAASYWVFFGNEHLLHAAYTYRQVLKAHWHVVDPLTARSATP